ncbi:MAG: ribonuclease T2 [Paracoccaceae bacterium]
MRWLLIWIVSASTVWGGGDKSGDFDYYVLALSWSPNWCARVGDARNSEQCDTQHDYGWILHGLWPQYHRGYPEYCRTSEPSPSRSMTNAMVDIMGSSGLAWHQWRKHGVCSGLSAADYFNLSREAYGTIVRPLVFRHLDKAVKLPAKVVEDAFLKDNPALEPSMITITCKEGFIEEARICLSRDLTPIPCGQGVARDCTLERAVLDAVR